LLFPLSGCCFQEQATKTNEPLESDIYTWNFGQAKEGVVLKHAFIFKNDSKTTINVKDVQTSCGCTVSKIAKKNILPGESTSIEVEFNTKGYSGPVQQYIYLNTDDLDNPIIRYIIKADLIK
jgi:hypothetical protein